MIKPQKTKPIVGKKTWPDGGKFWSGNKQPPSSTGERKTGTSSKPVKSVKKVKNIRYHANK